MANAPAFQMYAADFLVDTLDWTVDEIGIYIRLLLYEWVNKELPIDPKRLAKIAGTSPKKFTKRWSKIQFKFIQNGNGFLINERLEETRQDQEKFRQGQSIAGKKGIEKKRKLGIYPFEKSSDPLNTGSSDPSSGNQALQSSPSLKKKTYVEGSDELRLSKLLFDLIQKRKPDFKKPNLQAWAKYINLMIHKDRRKVSVITEVIKWAQLSDFWQNNILSTQKLRKQFDQLELKMNQEVPISGNLIDTHSNPTCEKCQKVEARHQYGDDGPWLCRDCWPDIEKNIETIRQTTKGIVKTMP